jgi:hypothetical protein
MTFAREFLLSPWPAWFISWHRVVALCKRYVEEALDQADLSEIKRLAAEETSRASGQNYVILV